MSNKTDVNIDFKRAILTRAPINNIMFLLEQGANLNGLVYDGRNNYVSCESYVKNKRETDEYYYDLWLAIVAWINKQQTKETKEIESKNSIKDAINFLSETAEGFYF